MSGGSAPRLAPPPVPIRTERLTLRYITSDDLDALRYYQDPEVCRYLPFPPADDAALAKRVGLMTERLAPSVPDDVLSLAVVHDETLVGDVMLRLRTRSDDQSPPSVAEIGWAFAPSYAGRGFATEAATALVRPGLRPLPAAPAHRAPGSPQRALGGAVRADRDDPRGAPAPGLARA